MKILQDQISKTIIAFLFQEPFYAHFLSGLNKVISKTQTQTIASTVVDNYLLLYLHPNYWKEQLLTPELRYGALKHEVLHALFRHPVRALEYENPLLFGLAADLQVNQYLNKNQLLENAVTFASFPTLDFMPEASLEHYYRQLEGAEISGAVEWSLEHQHWFQPRSALENSLWEVALRNTVRRATIQHNRSAIEQLPLALQDLITDFEITPKAKVNWRRMLRLFTETSAQTRLRNTIRRTSKRYGTSPGIKIKKKQKLLLVVDTSGSIAGEELKVFFKEIHQIWRQGTDLEIIESDVEVQKVWQYKGFVPSEVVGRGDTNFDAAIRYANRQHGFGGIIYFTDGQAQSPSVFSRLPILWVITEQGIEAQSLNWRALPGRKVKMD